MKLELNFFCKIVLLLSLVLVSFFTQKTVTLVVGEKYYSCSSNYRTLYDLSSNAPFPFSSFQSSFQVKNRIIHEGETIWLNGQHDEP